MPNILDRLVGLISPDAGLRRVRARELLTRAYEGASQRDGWKPKRAGASANTDHRADGATLRVRARSLYQNVPYITAGVEAWVANHIGTGIIPRSLAKNADVIDALYDAWGKKADADAIFDVNGLVAAAERAAYVDGECLVRLRPRLPSDGLPVPLQLQLLEIDWLDSAKGGNNGANTIVNGKEYDPLGRLVAYWLFDQHPGEQASVFKGRAASHPVPAERIIHYYAPVRPGQARGVSMLAPVIARVRDLMLYEDAELQRKNLETRLGVLASGDVETLSTAEQNATDVKQTGELGQLSSGGITRVPTGTNLTIVEPKAAPGYVDYVKYQLHLIASGMGVTYEMLTGDMREVNFSSARVRLLEFRRRAEQRQWLNTIPTLSNRIWEAFLDAAVLAGKLPRADYSVDWSTPKWDYVNPEQDVKADLAEISGGLSSISEKLRRRGYKPDLVFKEIKSDFDRLRADGTLDIFLQLQTNQAPQVPKPAAAATPAARTFEDTVLDELTQQRTDRLIQENRMGALMAMMNARHPDAAGQGVTIQNIMPPTPATPVEIRNEITTPAQTVHVTNEVQPTPVEIRNEVTTTAPLVNVTNQVQPAAVDVSVTATLPKRISETTVERDAQRNITRSVTTERDA